MAEAFVDNFSEVGTGKQLGKTSRYRCRWCGFPVNALLRTNRAPEGEADGNDVVTSGSVATYVTASRGCPCCGRYRWAKYEPAKIDPLRYTRRRVESVGRIFRRRKVRF